MNSPISLPRFEEEMIKRWQEEDTFGKSLSRRKSSPLFSFYDGPPFASGEPHYGHVEQSAVKDAIARYKTMRGYYVPRKIGWDTHGLPVEYLVEKAIGTKTKQDILAYGVDKFNKACRDIVFKYRQDFEKMFTRIGRWADPTKAYATLDNNYIESVWWVFSQLHRKGLVYEGFKSMPYCPRCATPLSNFEVNDGYKDNVKDPSLYVNFKLTESDVELVAWTTTPWSLPGNIALAVHPQAKYVQVLYQGKHLIIAATKLDILDGDYKIESEFVGSELAGKAYEPLFKIKDFKATTETYKIWTADFVSTEDGTGVLHVAPAFGEDDLNLAVKHQLPVLSTVDTNGRLTDNVELDLAGLFFKDADRPIIELLTKQGRVFAAETAEHTYPFCWRCETPLLYFAINTWFVKVSALRDRLIKNNQEINWVPEHIQKGRMGLWLEGARDWAISRNRFWGAPIPVWRCEQGHNNVIPDIATLKKNATTNASLDDLHKPGIDEITIRCLQCQQPAKRIEEVFDCWFESGSMPYGQDHYPFSTESSNSFEARFPADFVVEAMEQTHLWFYVLHVLATALFDKPAYKNVIADGLILAADGRKLSKRLRNYPPANELFESYGADSLRFFLLSSPLMSGEDVRLDESALRDVQRNIFLTLWNVYGFFETYRKIQQWELPKIPDEPSPVNSLDRWIIARLNETIASVTGAADEYEIARAIRPIGDFIDDLSNWYVRRSRRRFWKNEDETDIVQAFTTLHFVLVRLSQILAPWSPFLSDKIYSALMGESVHLTDWPLAGDQTGEIIEEMALARRIVQEGLAKRAAYGIKIRQPLQTLMCPKLPNDLAQIVMEEVNVKEIVVAQSVDVSSEITTGLREEGMARDLVRYIQSARKAEGLSVSDRVSIELSADEEATAAIKNFQEFILNETNATKIVWDEVDAEGLKLGSGQVRLRIKKA